ncbi:MAG TPA: GAF domain-containing sensor histidine kinase [Candidatus Saccharimonadales bacterium]|nr:GAF domain-containing sensor histidine kinase [Candidatus Saccharimonadales bacterium]
MTKPSPKAKTDVSADIPHITQEMYKQNRELAERNKMLMLLRKIDEIVLSSETEPHAVAQRIVHAVSNDGDFPVAGIYLADRRKTKMVAVGISNRSGKIAEIEAQSKLSQTYIGLHSSNPATQAVKRHKVTISPKLLSILKPSLKPADEQEIAAVLGVKNYFLCPLESRDELLGLMIIGTTDKATNISEFDHTLVERLTGAIGIAIDNALLDQDLQEATKRLRTANRHLKELDRAKDEFISMASHQLRTPLTSIKGYISMLLEGDAGKLEDEQREFLNFAYGGAQRMVNLISDLLNVSRMSAGRFFIEKQAIDLTKLVTEEVQALQSHAADKQLKLVLVRPPSPLPMIDLDENKTRQVIMNFIDNAIYYTKKGSITVSVKKSGNCAILMVEDTGMGVPPDAQKKLFTKFFRADNAQSARPDGTGLGLYLAKRVIQDQGGTIIFESVEGEGSTFGFCLPIKPGANHDTHK